MAHGLFDSQNYHSYEDIRKISLLIGLDHQRATLNNNLMIKMLVFVPEPPKCY